MTNNPIRIVLGVLFGLWALGSFAILSAITWAIGIGWGCLSCRMLTHRWPLALFRERR